MAGCGASGRFLFVRLNSGPLGYHLDAARDAPKSKIRLRPSIAAALRASRLHLADRPACRSRLPRRFQVEPPAARRQLGQGSAERSAVDDVVPHVGAGRLAANYPPQGGRMQRFAQVPRWCLNLLISFRRRRRAASISSPKIGSSIGGSNYAGGHRARSGRGTMAYRTGSRLGLSLSKPIIVDSLSHPWPHENPHFHWGGTCSSFGSDGTHSLDCHGRTRSKSR